MGHLYAAEYLSSADLVDAARTLVAGGITHSEQLVALRDLLAPSTAGLSSAPAHEQGPMSAVMREVAAKGAGLREEQSLRGTPVESAELRTLVDVSMRPFFRSPCFFIDDATEDTQPGARGLRSIFHRLLESSGRRRVHAESTVFLPSPCSLRLDRCSPLLYHCTYTCRT